MRAGFFLAFCAIKISPKDNFAIFQNLAPLHLVNYCRPQ
jgi:hypothetical protein